MAQLKNWGKSNEKNIGCDIDFIEQILNCFKNYVNCMIYPKIH
jgi:hypothetical protein